MLKLVIKGVESFNDETNEFIAPDEDVVLHLEHSLVSLSKWESKWKKPFMGDSEKTSEEIYSYIQMMSEEDVSDEVVRRLSEANLETVNSYIKDPMTATWFREERQKTPSNEVITAEIIYYWMISMNIPFECQYWHLNKLITQIRVISNKNEQLTNKNKPKAPTKSDLEARRALNAARREQMNTSG